MTESEHPQEREDDLLSVGEAAKLAGVSTDTMRRWNREGRIDAMRTAGNQRRFRRAAVTALLTRGAA